MKPFFSIFFHNYYGEHEKWLQYFINNFRIPFTLYYNIVSESIYNVNSNPIDLQTYFKKHSGSNLSKIIIRKSSNKGKDIGGKIILLDSYQKLGEETKYGIFLHDKKSPYKPNNKTWSNDLLKISESIFIQKSIRIFDNDEKIGIVAAKGTIKNEYDPVTKMFSGKNNLLLEKLINRYGLFVSNYDFVAGTMFWFRMNPMHDFFTKHQPMEIRKSLENGNVLDEFIGTYTHCWERMLTWIVIGERYKIKII